MARYGSSGAPLPVDFPPHAAVYAFFVRWSVRGLPERLAGRLRGRIRIAAGRGELPTAGSIDSQSVKASEAVAAGACGYDAGKKTKGQKRHIAVDTLGLLLCVIVTAASVQDRDGAHSLLVRLREKFSTVTLVWADGGYSGRLVEWAKSALALTVSIVKRSDAARGFVVLPRRWVVERSFAWLTRYRRLVRVYERDPAHHEAMIWWATVHHMTRRLTRELAGEPPGRRWGDPPPLPELASPDARGKVVELIAAQPWRAWKRGRASYDPRDRQRQQLPCPAVAMVASRLHQKDRTSPLRAGPGQCLTLCHQALTGDCYARICGSPGGDSPGPPD